VVLDTTADEGTVAVERTSGERYRSAAKRVHKSGTRPVGTAIAAIHVGEDIWGHQIADPRTCRPGVLQLDRRGPTKDRILNSTLQAAELAVAEDTEHPGRADLPVV